MGGAIKSVANVVAAPFVAPVKAVTQIVRGENVATSIGGAALSTGAALNPVGQAEMLASGIAGKQISPTGYGAVASGDLSPDALKRYAISSAVATGGALGGIAGATGGLTAATAASRGDVVGVVQGLSGVNLPGMNLPSLPAVPPELLGLGAAIVGGGSQAGGSAPVPRAPGGSTPAAVSGGQSLTPLLVGAGVLAFGFLALRKGKR